MNTRNPSTARALPGGRVPDAIVADLPWHAAELGRVAAFEDILHTVWECERFEREHPFTVATIRSLAPRVRHDA